MSHRTSLWFVCISATALLTAPELGLAAADTDKAEAKSTTNEGLETIVVTARRRDESLQTVPVSVSAVSSSTLAQLNVTRADDLSRLVPNLSIAEASDSVGGNTVFIRGIGEQEPILTIESPVGIYLDGVYLGGQAGNNFDVPNLERVEVLRGPQGTLYGRNTTGGAVNLITKDPTDGFGFEEKAQYQRFNYWTSHTTVNTGKLGGSDFAATVSYFHRGGGGFTDNQNFNWDPGEQKTDAFWGKLKGKIGAMTVTLSADFDQIKGMMLPWVTNYVYSDNGLGGNPLAYFSQSQSYGGDPLTIKGSLPNKVYLQSNVGPEHYKNWGTALTLQYDFSDNVNLKSITAYREFEIDETTAYYQGDMSLPVLYYPPPSYLPSAVVAPTSMFMAPTDRNQEHQFSEELQLNGTAGSVNYTAGLYFFSQHIEEYTHQYFTLVFPGYFFGLPMSQVGMDMTQTLWYLMDAKSYAGYGQVSYHPAAFENKLELTGGVRYTQDRKDYDQPSIPIATMVMDPTQFLNDNQWSYGPSRAAKNDFSNTSWLGSASYQWTKDLMGYLRISTGFKSGGYDARAGVGIGGQTVPFTFQPEHATAYEMGAKSQFFDSRLQVNGAVYYTKYENLQESQFSGAQGFVPKVNAHYQGFELEAVAVPMDGLKLMASVGYVDPVYDKFEPAPGIDLKDSAKFQYVPDWTVHAGIQYDWPQTSVGVFSARADYSYTSERYFMASDYCTPALCLNPKNEMVKDPGQSLLSARVMLDKIDLGKDLVGEVAVYGSNLLNKSIRVSG
ncbi:MAG TPA: TonB-dependent receptor, partial [Steroidobacteraceae bacterium]|nr:TonB-dependent receptor [Steroidobacteraceae bacterium]